METGTERIAKTSQPASLLESDPEPTSVKTSKPANTPGKFPQGAPVKVEEVEMVIQPASYTQPESTPDNLLASLNTTPREPTPARAPNPAGKSMPGLDPQSKAKQVTINGNLSEEDEAEAPPRYYRNYYRSRQWRRYWRPKTVVYNASEVQKPQRPMKDYVSTGDITRNQSTSRGPEAVVY